jgi:hypothetical protein
MWVGKSAMEILPLVAEMTGNGDKEATNWYQLGRQEQCFTVIPICSTIGTKSYCIGIICILSSEVDHVVSSQNDHCGRGLLDVLVDFCVQFSYNFWNPIFARIIGPNGRGVVSATT